MKKDEICMECVEKLTCEKVRELGVRIKTWRLEKELTQSDLAFYIFSDKGVISDLERGLNQNISLKYLLRLSEFFDVSLIELLA